MSVVKSKVLAAVATLAIVGTTAAAPGAATAATPQCGGTGISVFSSEPGTVDQPNFVKALLGGRSATSVSRTV